MWRIISTIPDILIGSIFLIPLVLIILNIKKESNKNKFLLIIFGIYLMAVWSLVGMPNILYMRFEINYNFIPFKGMISELTQSLLNVLLFVPLGFLLPIISNKFKKTNSILLAGFLSSLLIELMQMFTYRATDVNDLITNVFGTLLGFGLYKILKLILKPKKRVKNISNKENNNENEKFNLYVIYIVVFVTMFILKPISVWIHVLQNI